MDQIDRLLTDDLDRRRQAAHDALRTQDALNAATAALTEARRQHIITWDGATGAGWTARDLRTLGITEPAEDWRPRKRVRRPRTASTDTPQ